MRPGVLVIEDHELNRELLSQLLEDDFDVTTREDGTSGLEAAKELHPDLILLDLSLPGIDGWEVARRVKADPDLADVGIIALTAHAMPGDAQEALAAGCDAYLAKPLDESALFAEMRRLLEQ